jgi:hypothetical protein
VRSVSPWQEKAPLALLKINRIAEVRQESAVIEALGAGDDHFYADRIREILARCEIRR